MAKLDKKILSDMEYEFECFNCGELYDLTGATLLEEFGTELEAENLDSLISAESFFHEKHCPHCEEDEHLEDLES